MHLGEPAKLGFAASTWRQAVAQVAQSGSTGPGRSLRTFTY
jgi:hypothetical protein